jgi:hypothetical protein
LGRNVVDDRYPQRSDGPGQTEVEAGIVDKQYRFGAALSNFIPTLVKQVPKEKVPPSHFPESEHSQSGRLRQLLLTEYLQTLTTQTEYSQAGL